jgi:predicted enzyme related to lactoylglutathione lyase
VASLGLAAVAIVALPGCGATQTKTGPFASTTIDVGMVVSDIEAAARFYKEAVGFTEVKGFDVMGQMGAEAGLSDSKPFHVRVFVLADAPAATKIKLIQFADAPGKKIDNTFIHSSLGMRYLTIAVTDMTAAVERANKAGATPIAKGPMPLPEGFPKGVYLAVLRDPDGNMVELVGPKK